MIQKSLICGKTRPSIVGKYSNRYFWNKAGHLDQYLKFDQGSKAQFYINVEISIKTQQYLLKL